MIHFENSFNQCIFAELHYYTVPREAFREIFRENANRVSCEPYCIPKMVEDQLCIVTREPQPQRFSLFRALKK